MKGYSEQPGLWNRFEVLSGSSSLRRANLRAHRFPRCTIFGVDSNFDQFMMVESQQDFMNNRRGDAVVADDHDRLAVMGQGCEMTLLRVGQDGHGITGHGERF